MYLAILWVKLLIIVSVIDRRCYASWQKTAYLDIFSSLHKCSPYEIDVNQTRANITNDTASPPQDDLATFDEWRQKVLMAENNSEKLEVEAPPTVIVKVNNLNKQSRTNYASTVCGARIVASNPESTNPNAVLTSSPDDYMNNPCSAVRKYFVVELCDSVSISDIEIGNLELFSSLPKILNFSVSDRYPNKEWTRLGRFVAPELRQFNSFKMVDFYASGSDVKPSVYAKFVKVEILDHYGSEHYCPITAIRVYGVGLLDDIDDDVPDADVGGDSLVAPEAPEQGKPPNTLYNVAKEKVLEIVQHVLPPKPAKTNVSESEISNGSLSKPTFLDFGRVIQSFPVFRFCVSCQRKPAVSKFNSSICRYFRAVVNYDLIDSVNIDYIVVNKFNHSGQSTYNQNRPNNLSETGMNNSRAVAKGNKTGKIVVSDGGQTVVPDEDGKILDNRTDKPTTDPTPPPKEVPTETPISNSEDGKVDGAINKKADRFMPEEVIMNGIMVSVDNIATDDDGISEDRESKNGADELNTSQQPPSKGQASKPASSSKQPLVRFMSKFRELEGYVKQLERNLSLTSRYLEELSLNYRKRLDEMKLKVDALSNLTAAQATEIERLSNQLNKTNRIFANMSLSANHTEIVNSAVPFASLLISVICFFALTFTCICRHRPPPQDTQSVKIPQPPKALQPKLANCKPNTSKSVERPCLKLTPPESSSSVASAPASPTLMNRANGFTSRRRSHGESTMLHATPNGYIFPATSYDTCNSLEVFPPTPTVIPTNYSQSFLLTPVDNKSRRRKRNRHHRHIHENGSNGRVKSNSPYRGNSATGDDVK